MKTVIPASWIFAVFALLADPVNAQDCTADTYEPNNAPAEAAEVTAGTYADLTACIEDEGDWYSIDVPANNGLVVDLSFAGDEADLDLYLYDANAPTVPLHTSMSSGDTEQVFVDFFIVDTTILIKVNNFDAHNDRWTPYNMQITLVPGGYYPCGEGDDLEPNDTFEDPAYLALPIDDESLTICDEDWYVFAAPAGQGVKASIDFVHADADINMALFTQDNTNVPLVRASNSTDNETLCYGASESTQVFLLFVYEQGGLHNGETPYALHVELSNETCAYQPEPVDAGVVTDANQVGGQDATTANTDAGTDPKDSSNDSGSLCSMHRGAGNSGVFLLVALTFIGVLRRR